MRFIRCSVVAMIGSLLLLSTAFAQTEKSLAKAPDRDSPQTWTLFHIDKFDVLMPASPTLKQETLLISGQQVLLRYYGTTWGQSDYAVLTLDGLSNANWHVAHMLMLDFYCRSSSPFNASFQKDISLNGYSGKQFILDSVERVGEWRIYEVNKTFFAIAGSSNPRYAYSFARFFDSFSISADNATPANTNVTANNPTPANTNVTANNPTRANTNVAANNPTRANTNVTAEKRVSNPTGRWLVILQTFSRHERARANQRMNFLRGRGYDTAVVSTDSYSNLKPGLLVLAMGPFSKRTAEQRLGELRLVAPQSYIKAGW